ncbi:MAG: ATP-binding protein [Anaerolineaceae bacterium]
MSMLHHEVGRLVGKAINHYRLIEDGDKIAVAVSGGKDSMLLLRLLRERLKRVPIDYELIAVHVAPGFDSESVEELEAFFKREGFRYEIIRTDYGIRAHGPENRENPCFLCARLRRTALFKKAWALGCHKIALGHNQDDLIETFFINMCYAGQASTMVPKQLFFGGEVTVVRPLVLVSSSKADRLCRQLEIPIIGNACPSADRNRRREIRDLLDALYKQNRKVRGNLFHAMSNLNLEYLPPPLKSSRDGYLNLLEFLSREKDGVF